MEIKKTLFFCVLFLFSVNIFCQAPLQNEQIRIQVWAELDSFPGKFEEESSVQEQKSSKQEEKSDFEKLYGFAIERTKQIAPFLMEGLLYGWNFDYTPYDKKRGVKEYWEFSEVRKFDSSINRLEYHNPVPKDGKLLSWVYCDRTQAQQLEYKRRMGFSVPDDISICGFTNGDRAKASDPMLTTVEQRGVAVGEEAANILIGQVEGSIPKDDVEKRVVRTRLVVRGTTR